MPKAAKPVPGRGFCLRAARSDEFPTGAVGRRYSTAMASPSGLIVGKKCFGGLPLLVFSIYRHYAMHDGFMRRPPGYD
jgi:hypothetical protein